MRLVTLTLIGCLGIACGGCSLLSNRPTDADSVSLLAAIEGESASNHGVVANPPARSIRFDGREIVLGSSTAREISAEELDRRLSELLAAEKLYTARTLVRQNRSTAEQLLWKLAGQPAAQPKAKLIANELSVGVDPAVSWTGWLAQAGMQRKEASAYYTLRNTFAERLRTEQPSDQECDQLRSAAQAVTHPLATIDALHLFGVRELVAGRTAWAEALFLQAAEVAEQNHDYQRAASAWSMVVLTAQTGADFEKSESSWNKAVEQQVKYEQAAANKIIHPFWARAAELRPGNVEWPQSIAAVLASATDGGECPVAKDADSELVLNIALATSAYSAANPQVALIHYKQAEQRATPEQVMWLRIAQGRCLASLGQTQAAAALLSSPASNKDQEIAAAAMAAIGSAKLESGAYQQGAQLLHKALSGEAGAWPSRNQAEADLALAMLIIGDSDAGLEKLEAVQQKMETDGQFTALLRALDNQLELAIHENREEDASRVRERIKDIELSRS